MKKAVSSSVFVAILLWPTIAYAHWGHAGEVAAHSHWVGIGALAAAAALAALVGKKVGEKQQEASDEEAEIAQDAETEAGAS